MDLFIDLLVNLSATIIWVIFTIIWMKKIYPAYRRRTLKNLWGLEDDDVTIVVAATPSIDCKYRKKTDDCYWSTEHGPIIGYGDATALGLVLDSIRSISETINLNVMLSTSIGSETKDDNLILIGGPVYNALVGEIIRMTNPPVKFSEYSAIEQIGQNSKTMNPAISGETILHDYGLVIKTRNPFNPSKIVFIIAGCHDPGSMAAAQYVVSTLLKTKKRPTFFGLVVEASVSDFYVANPQLVSKIHEIKFEQ